MSPQTRAVENWTLQPLTDFVREASARLVLVLTPSGQVLAQSGFSRAVDVMSAAALAASLAGRLRRAMEAAGTGTSVFWHLQAEQGALLVVPGGNNAGGILVVAVAEPDVNVGLVRLELLRAAETMV